MLKKQSRRIIVIACLLFLVMQTLIFASIPKDTDSETIKVVVKNGTSTYQIADMLKEDDIIYSSHLFMLFTLLTGGKLKAGEYDLRKSMSTMDIIEKMERGERNIYMLKVVEGYNIYNVADMMEHAGIMGRDEFIRLAKNEVYLGKLGIKGDSLEGYLTPDTYYYSKEMDIEKFIEKIVQRTIKLFEKEDIKSRMNVIGFDMYKTLTLASMIEKEAKLRDEKPLIAAVFHNRLKKEMSLDCDPTIIYGIIYGTGAFLGPIKKSDIITYTSYNTYTFKGLPRGPICNPDKSSIMAALYPAPVDYLYFVSRNDGTHVFSKDMKTHNHFVATYQRSKNSKKP
ncbi:MAG: endolytic transglycosylase MltG [Proteobacteria bacterium]|nr:endolytic transglycosylase MltG [Pseudomonadota bacterium]